MSAQKGNVLFLILIAVALFAALSYAVTRSTRGGGNTANETSRLDASQIIQIASSLKVDIDRFMIIHHLDIHEISFTNPVEGGYTNPAPFPTSQQLFHSNGGGSSWPRTPGNTAKWILTGSSGALGFGKDSGCTNSTPCSELMLILNDVPLDLCKKLNDLEGVTNTGGNPPLDSGDWESIPFQGSRTNFLAGGHMFNGTNGENDGKLFGCVETTQGYRGAPGTYYFYYVLLTDIHS